MKQNITNIPKIIFITFFVLTIVFFISGCTQNTSPAAPVTTQENTPAPVNAYNPTYTMQASGCDNTSAYFSVTPDSDYIGIAELRILDPTSPANPVLSTKQTQVNLKGQQSNYFSIDHNSQIASTLNFELCIAGDCQKGYCTPDNCLQYSPSSLLCNSLTACTEKNGLCQHFLCDDFKVQDQCENTMPGRCEWFNDTTDRTQYCRLKGCALNKDEVDCNAGYNCQWAGNICITFSCRSLSTNEICGQDPRCQWKTSTYGAGDCESKSV